MPPDIQLYNQEVDLRSQMLISLINGHNPVLDDKSGGMDGPCGRITPVETNAEKKSQLPSIRLLKNLLLRKEETGWNGGAKMKLSLTPDTVGRAI